MFTATELIAWCPSNTAIPSIYYLCKEKEEQIYGLAKKKTWNSLKMNWSRHKEYSALFITSIHSYNALCAVQIILICLNFLFTALILSLIFPLMWQQNSICTPQTAKLNSKLRVFKKKISNIYKNRHVFVLIFSKMNDANIRN